MAFNINTFSKKISEHGLAQSNLFYVRIATPQVIADAMNDVNVVKDIEFFCRSVTLPEMDISTSDIQHQGFGATTRRPQGMTFQVIPAVFMMDSEFGVMKFFHRWAQSIINYDTSAGTFSDVGGLTPYEMGYKSEYATTMTIVVYSYASESITYTYKLGGVYPVNIGNVSAAWENTAEIMTLPVGFTYDTIEVSGAQTGVVADRAHGINGLLTWFSSINSYAQAITGLKKPTSIQDAINSVTNISTIVNSFKR